MLEEDYINCYHDSIEGIYIFKTIEEIAEFVMKIETDINLYNKLLKDVEFTSVKNNTLTDENILESINWIENILNQ